jgi:chitosanase
MAIGAIVNVFETGRVRGDYGAIAVLKGDTGHLSYGRSQVTLGSGSLFQLLDLYCGQTGTKFANDLQPHLARFRQKDVTLDNDSTVKDLLRRAGREDPVMRATQDQFFREHYLGPACRAAENIGISLPLGQALVYDSHIQGGWGKLSARIGPVGSGKQEDWIGKYIDMRREWLLQLKPPVPATVYRMDSFKGLIADKKWNLDLPFTVHGVMVTEEALAGGEAPVGGAPARTLTLRSPYLRGDDVKALQAALAAKGLPNSQDGVYGPVTDVLVKQWQKKQSPAITETGVGPETRKSLGLVP